MQTPLSIPENYGLALRTTNKLISGKTLTGHTGSAYGLYSAMFFDPKQKFGMVVITNGTGANETDGFKNIIKESFNILYQHLIAK